jgi:uncharacterized protein (TIGR02271 family)
MQQAEAIHPGMDVFAADGHRVGHVVEVSDHPVGGREDVGYLRIRPDGLGDDRQVYVPASSVREVRPEGIYLSVDEVAAGQGDATRRTSVVDDHGRERDAPADAGSEWSRPLHETLELRGEVLEARTEPIQTGELEIRKEVITEERTLEVPVRREEVVIERRPVERTPATETMGEGGVLRIPVWEEQVQVEKRPVVIEELHVSKQVVEETKQVTGTVQREAARLERAGDVAVHGDEAL